MRTASFSAPDEELDRGFTLIELLVVVLVIGILAAIAIPSLISQRESAHLAAVRTDLRHASIAAETFVARTGSMSGLDVDALMANGYVPTPDVLIEVQPATTAYVITATNARLGSDQKWSYSSATGVISG